jgi:HTH-type transcriptional regulator/antitoxin HigA
LDLLSDLVVDYEEDIMPTLSPTLSEVINLRMYKMGLTQLRLSELLNISPSQVSEYLSGKSKSGKSN